MIGKKKKAKSAPQRKPKKLSDAELQAQLKEARRGSTTSKSDQELLDEIRKQQGLDK
jgi:hypothetical protein